MCKVSVLIPTFNRRRLLLQCLNTIRGQTHADLSIVVYDDGSTDDTERYVKKINDPRIRYFKDNHRGVSYARNSLLEISKDLEFACWQDSDDISNIYRIEKQLALLKRIPKGCVTTCHTRLYRNNKDECYTYPKINPNDRSGSFASTMFRSEQAVQFTPGVDMGGEDVDWARDMKATGIAYINTIERLYYVRLTNTDRIGCLKFKDTKGRAESNARRT